MLLELDQRLEICGEASTLNEAMIMTSNTDPDVILLDFKLPDGDGIIGCNNIKRQFPRIKIIILTAYADDHIVIEAIRAGADYLKEEADETVIGLKKQYEELLGYLIDKDIRESIAAMYEPGDIVKEEVDGFTGATIRAGKIISAVRDGLNRGVYSY